MRGSNNDRSHVTSVTDVVSSNNARTNQDRQSFARGEGSQRDNEPRKTLQGQSNDVKYR